MKKFLFTILIISSFSALSYASNGKTTILKGQVTDEQGEPVVGAKVVVENSDEFVYTDFDGEFTFSKLSKSTQKITVSMISFEDRTSTINLSSPNSKELSIKLESK